MNFGVEHAPHSCSTFPFRSAHGDSHQRSHVGPSATQQTLQNSTTATVGEPQGESLSIIGDEPRRTSHFSEWCVQREQS